MCLYIEVKAASLDWRRGEKIARGCSTSDGLEVTAWPRRFRLARGHPTLTIADHSQGCACSLLSDDGAWDDPVWTMDASALPRLAQTIDCLMRFLPEEFTLQASWAGDQPTEEKRVSRPELLAIALEDRLGVDTLYRVAPQSATGPRQAESETRRASLHP